jgi:hypothetical protein
MKLNWFSWARGWVLVRAVVYGLHTLFLILAEGSSVRRRASMSTVTKGEQTAHLLLLYLQFSK